MKQYLDLFDQQRTLLDAHAPQWVNAHRDTAAATCRRLGFPTQRDERYRYTPVAGAFAPDYGLNLGRLPFPADPYHAFKCDVPNLSTDLHFIINDSVSPREPTAVSSHYNTLAATMGRDDAITALNTMLCQDVFVIHIPAGTHLERPLQVVNILTSQRPLMANRRVLIVAEEDTSASILFCDHCATDTDFLTTQVTEVLLGPRAHVELYDLEESHRRQHRFANLYARVDEQAHLTHAAITLTGGITRNQTDVLLAAPYASVDLYGCAITDGTQHADTNTLITHAAPDTTSTELYRYVVDEQSQGAFAGRILVEPQAQRSQSHETNANLVCTPQARMWTQPMLEIYADDVQCAHGSTVGQLSADALFYMQQRGIPLPEAHLLLKQAFAAEVLEHISLQPLRQRLTHLIDKRFRHQLGTCDTCTLCHRQT